MDVSQEALIAEKGEDGAGHSESHSSMHSGNMFSITRSPKVCLVDVLQEALIAEKDEHGVGHSESQSSMHSDSLPAGSIPPGALPSSSPSAGDYCATT